MSTIKFVIGDATDPQGDGLKFLPHVCNNVGGWGAGYVLALSRRWGEPEFAYRTWHHRGKDPEAGTFTLGRVQFVPVREDITVCNMVAQSGYGSRAQHQHKSQEDQPGPSIPLKYDMLQECLERVGVTAKLAGASVHMPRIGCGLAGGTWDKVEEIIKYTLLSRDIDVTVYDPK